MNKGGIGIGSSSIVLVFAVLCLAIFALIALTSAQRDMAMANAEADMAKAYYEADTLAEGVLNEMITADTLPEMAMDVEIFTQWDEFLEAETAEYTCPVSDKKELYVKIAFYLDSYETLAWRMRDIGGWEIDDGLDVWSGWDMEENEDMVLWEGE